MIVTTVLLLYSVVCRQQKHHVSTRTGTFSVKPNLFPIDKAVLHSLAQ